MGTIVAESADPLNGFSSLDVNFIPKTPLKV